MIPIFIGAILLSFGFTHQEQKNQSSFLFASFLSNLEELNKEASARVSNGSENQKPNWFERFIPDSINDAKRKIDSLNSSAAKLDSTFLTDSTVINKAIPDSLVKKDTSKIAKADTVKQKTLEELLFDAEAKLKKDTTNSFSLKDSLRIKAKADSLRRVELASKDSTARLKHFRFEQNEEPVTSFRDIRRSQLFLRPTGSINRTVSLDSTGTIVIIEETIAGQKVKPKLEIPLDEYIELRLAAIKRDIWELKGYEYQLKDTKKDLSQLITDITNIDIPLPSNPILSIFGPPKINLRINGQVDIHGAWRNETTEGITSSALGNTRNEPDFKQTVQINLSGTIGDKLNLSADWNTERQFQYENQLKIKYTGYEDEIVQSVEGGNVSLQTSPLVGGSEALFGIKAHFKMGPFSLTALASQKKSEVKEVSYTGGSKSQKFEIRAYDYSPNHFFVDSIYQNRNENVFNKYYGNATPIPTNHLRIKDIQVWKTTTGLFNPTERKANAYINLPQRRKGELYKEELRDIIKNNTVPGRSEIDRRFILLTEGTDYIIHPETGFITFKTQIQDQDAVAVSYYIEGATNSADDDIYYGEFTRDAVGDSTTRLVLKLIRPSMLQPQFRDAWKLQLRNIYPIGGRRIKEEGFSMDIKQIVEGAEPQDNINGVKLLQAFGFDNTDKSKTSTTPDGAFDFFAERTIMPETGEIIFPVLQPFGRDFPSQLPAEYKFPAVYDTTVTFAKQDRAKDKFILVGEYSADVSSTINIGFNVVENSVRVLLNGSPLQEGVDYEVDYNLGQVIIRNDNALVPGADLKITSEQNDLFTLASKTMLGFRGLYEFNRETSLGFSFLNLNQQTLSDKVRIGEEPLNNSIFGVDFRTNVNLPFVTKALDKLISTSAQSNFTINAEMAYIDPDPNTKKSTISSDGGRSIAYVDDFEGAKRTIPLGEAYGSWHDISIPTNLPLIGNLPEDDQMDYKAKTWWYNIIPSDVNIKDIYGTRKQAPPDGQQVTTLDFVYQPDRRGFYNYEPTLSDKSRNWGGIMKPLSSTANNLVEENIEFIEFWVNFVDAPAGSKIYMDLGQISEDVIPNRKLDTEDKNDNDLVDEGEDTGMDGLKSTEEPNYNSTSNPDPSSDNYSFQLKSNMTADDYANINGTEGNAVSIDLGRIPDTEDLNRNKTLDRTNSFFRYEIPLDTSKANPFVQGSGSAKGWYLFKIPLKDYSQKIGSPSFSVVETFRIWVSGIQQRVHLRFAEMNLVGSQWQKVLDSKVTVDDEVLTISTVNIEDNTDYYSPPGVQRERDRTQPEYNIQKNEQSLSLGLNKLADGDTREVVRYMARHLDVFNYKEMKLFLHGDLNNANGSVSYYKDAQDYASEIYLRFGADTANYYEYRQPVQAGWNEVSMKFADLTAIKQQRDSAKALYKLAVPDMPGHFYGIKGNPSLTKVSFFTIGIINPKDKGTAGQAVSGNVWVNELRVLEAEQTPGWAYSANASLQLADLMRVSFNASQTNPYFHKITERFGSREDHLNWGMTVDFDVLKLIPVNLSGSNLRVNYSRTENSSNPLYMPGTDIKVEEAQRSERVKLQKLGWSETAISSRIDSMKNVTQTVGSSEVWNVSNIRFKIPTEVWYIRDIFNNISLNFTYNRAFSRSPILKNSNSWSWNAGANYSVNFSRDLFFKPADIPIFGSIYDVFTDFKDTKIFFTPQSFNTAFTLLRKYQFTQSRTNESKPDIQRDFSSTRGAGLNWTFTEGGVLNLGVAYNFDVQSTLAYLLVDNGFEKQEGQIWREIFTGAFFGKDFNYRQSFDLRSNPRVPSWFGLNNFLTLTASYSASYQWQNNFQQKELGRSAGYSNRVSAGMTVRLKSIFEPLFKESEESKVAPIVKLQEPGSTSTGGRRSGRGAPRTTQTALLEDAVKTDTTKMATVADSLAIAGTDSLSKSGVDSLLLKDDIALDTLPKGPSIFSKSLEMLKLSIKYILFDYDQISINFSQNSTYAAGGLLGVGTGFNNFWGAKYNYDKGPSRMFMLGLTNDVGKRAPLGNLQDSYSHKNDIDLKTSRPLWEGAQIDLRWRVGWGINKTVTIQTDSFGVPSIANQVSSGSIDRSFLSLPPVLIFSFLKTGIKRVNELYDSKAQDPSKSLSEAFSQGFETLSILGKVPFLAKVLNYIPRPNWSFTWSGLERLAIFNFAKRVSLNHSYDANYSEGWRITEGNQEVQSQKVDYGFNPLMGLTFNFDELFGGQFQSTVRYSTKTGYSLGVTTRNITQAFSQDVNVSASYSKSGFSLPLFGIDLKNDIEISLSFTRGKTSSIIYEMDDFKEEGKPQEGKTNTTIEPKIRYVMSSRVTLSIFYRRTSIEPEGASRIPPTTTNEAGVDVRIAIQ
ncbi:MAG: gliding motility-related protein [Ignavibacteria bacterium]|nr:MAG: gliding motility-related protein [Ignavibacteria bacterium]KAF0158345.1 MAG: gliding motility-related protein [Ignavibacteria bacterium]